MESARSENDQGPPPNSAGAHAATVELEPTQTLPRDGWLDSGDRAYRVEGETYITSRVKNLIIRGGRNIYPRQVELAVSELAGVHKDCVVMFGAPDQGVLAPLHTVRQTSSGKLRRDPGLLGFHLGPFEAAVRADMPVVPVILRGTRAPRLASMFPHHAPHP
jgi:acyl-CoA synthetase (AMP-forming)/AMP-acid ligase II